MRMLMPLEPEALSIAPRDMHSLSLRSYHITDPARRSGAFLWVMHGASHEPSKAEFSRSALLRLPFASI